jgi:DNA topoisomerase-1
MSKNWKTFIHNGVMFSQPYIPHKIPILYNGSPIVLTPEQEEYATIYARYIDSEYYAKSIFKKNFFSDWKTLFSKDSPIKDINLCDFSKIRAHVLKTKEAVKNISKEEKKRIKAKKDKLAEKYKFAMIDGKKQPVGNFLVEPPSIFIGRGSHPSLGCIKWRVYPNDITLNLSKGAPIPEIDNSVFDANIDKKKLKWGEIIHEPKSYWLASWKDLITGKTKYVWLSDKSDIKASKDEVKFNIAKALGGIINNVRKKYNSDMISKDAKNRQIATAVYFIDIFALRVGNEKGDDEADTVGTVSLRVEHIKLLPDHKIELDFLGKDSVRYVNVFKIIQPVYDNLEKFIKGKSNNDNIFHLISTNDVNKYLKKFMKNLTARVFRTYNSSKLYQDEIFKLIGSNSQYTHAESHVSKGFSYNIKNPSSYSKQSAKKHSINDILNIINEANIAVAMLCNHQKNITKRESIKDKIAKLDKDSKSYKEKIKKIKEKEKSSHLALGTSKLNYIDPRITIATLKKYEIELDQYYNERELNKFKWAINTPKDYIF